MPEDQVKRAAVDYMSRALGKKAHYLDAVQTDDDWVVQVAVDEKERKGPGGPKRWLVLYEVHLGLDLGPLYHVRRGIWDKAVPAEAKDEEERIAPDAAQGEVRPGVVAPRDGDSEDGLEGAAEVRSPGPDPSQSLEPEEGPGVVEPGVGVDGQSTGEEAEAKVSAPEEKSLDDELLEPLEPEEEAGTIEEPVAGGTEDVVDDVDETLSEAIDDSGDEEPEPDGDETGTEQGPESETESEDVTEPEEETYAAEPEVASTPAVQERQGPPKVRFRFVADDSVRKTD